MISKYSPEYKALTTSQKAKVRKVLEAYKAEREPILFESNRRENEVRRQAYVDRDIKARVDAVQQKYNPQIKSIEENISALWKQVSDLQKERNDEELAITSEMYQAMYADPKREVLREMIQSVTERHEAKIAELLASFKQEEVA